MIRAKTAPARWRFLGWSAHKEAHWTNNNWPCAHYHTGKNIVCKHARVRTWKPLNTSAQPQAQHQKTASRRQQRAELTSAPSQESVEQKAQLSVVCKTSRSVTIDRYHSVSTERQQRPSVYQLCIKTPRQCRNNKPEALENTDVSTGTRSRQDHLGKSRRLGSSRLGGGGRAPIRTQVTLTRHLTRFYPQPKGIQHASTRNGAVYYYSPKTGSYHVTQRWR